MSFPVKSIDDHVLSTTVRPRPTRMSVALLTGGGDRHYAFGLATALISKEVNVDFIGGDEVDSAEMHSTPGLNFFNLRKHVRRDAHFLEKASRTVMYYVRLMLYATTAKPKVFHILWNNRFEHFDRTILMLYYKLLGKQIVLTAHNVNAGARDGADTKLNRLTLKIQYRLASHIFVHTEKMRAELIDKFRIRETVVSVIEYGINNAIPNTDLAPEEAKARLGINAWEKTILFFGNLAPYKGVEYLISAFEEVASESGSSYRLIVTGRPKKGCEEYVEQIQYSLHSSVLQPRTISRIELIPDEDVELYFKAADVLVLPYVHIFQSGVLFLGYSFGLPAIVTDVGSLRESIIEGVTGFVCRPNDATDLASAIRKYFSSSLYASLGSRRREIRDYMEERHSWAAVGADTRAIYAKLLEPLELHSDSRGR
jgi:D-inositol-3-phosphate glycosyltransferase